MKATKLIGFLLVTILTSMPAFSEPATPESVKHLLQKTGAGNMSVQMMQQMIPSLKKMIPNAPESFWSDVMSEVDASEIENMIIPIYQNISI